MSGNASEALRRARAEQSLLEEEEQASELDQALAQVQSELAAAANLPGSPVIEDQDFQFLEILNIASDAVNLEGCVLSDAVTFIVILNDQLLPPK